MENTYEVRAMKFARVLARMFEGCETLNDFEWAIKMYNSTHSRKLNYAHGVSRVAIIRADYVIKFDMVPQGRFEDGRAGNCDSEEEIYERACEDGFEYLLAKTSVHTIEDLTFSVMPRVDHVGDYDRNWYDTCTEEEIEWLENNVCDLHEGNIGYRHGKVCVIDYAWDATKY